MLAFLLFVSAVAAIKLPTIYDNHEVIREIYHCTDDTIDRELNEIVLSMFYKMRFCCICTGYDKQWQRGQRGYKLVTTKYTPDWRGLVDIKHRITAKLRDLKTLKGVEIGCFVTGKVPSFAERFKERATVCVLAPRNGTTIIQSKTDDKKVQVLGGKLENQTIAFSF